MNLNNFDCGYDGVRFYSNSFGVRFDLMAYIIETGKIISYYMCCKKGNEQEYMNNKNWTFLGYGYFCNTTLDNEVSCDEEVNAFFNKNF